MTPTDLLHRPLSRRCALLGAGGVGAAAVLAACSSGSDGDGGTAATSSAGTSSAPSSPAGSSSAPETTTGAPSSAAGSAAIASLSDIPVGGTASAQVDGENILLSQPEAGTVEAFSATCPHQGATVQPDGGKFKCPLHGSEFALDGSVTEGPAQSGLEPFSVSVSGDDVVAG